MAIDRDLAAPLDPRRVQTREGSGGKKLSYLTTHDVKRTANRIFGYDGWSYVVNDLISLGEESFKNSRGREGIRVGYRATVTVTIGDVQRGDVGYGDAMEYNQSRITPHELASKEAVSDALKRCLSSWGDQFGLVLYGEDPAPLEDMPPLDPEPQPESKRATKPKPDAKPDYPLSVNDVVDLDKDGNLYATAAQRKMLFAVGKKEQGLDDSQIRDAIEKLCGTRSTAEIPRNMVDAVVQELRLVGGAVPK